MPKKLNAMLASTGINHCISCVEGEEQINPGFVLHVLGLLVLGIFLVEVRASLVFLFIWSL